jgi:peroxiredoxin
MLKLPSDAQKRKGAGIIFEPCSLWGNGEYAVAIADFAAVTNPGRAWLPGVDELARTQALLIPRFRKETPPHHILIAPNGDILRGDLLAGTNSHFSFRVGLDTYQIPRDRVTTAIWLQKPPAEKKDQENQGPKSPESGLKEATNASPNVAPALNSPAQGSPTPKPETVEAPATTKKPTHWLQLLAGARFALTMEKMDGDLVIGRSEMFGRCQIPFSMIYRIRNTSPGADIVTRAFDSWKLEYAPEPEIPGAGGGDSPLLGKEAPDFTLSTVSGDKFQLRSLRGKVVVLDFWATWCAPCVRSMPGMIETLAQFPTEKVEFVGINRGENAAQVKKFLEQRGWQVRVALDSLEKVSLQYGVDGIPHTVIVGADGKVAWANTGDNSPALVPEVIRKLLEAKP